MESTVTVDFELKPEPVMFKVRPPPTPPLEGLIPVAVKVNVTKVLLFIVANPLVTTITDTL